MKCAVGGKPRAESLAGTTHGVGSTRQCLRSSSPSRWRCSRAAETMAAVRNLQEKPGIARQPTVVCGIPTDPKPRTLRGTPESPRACGGDTRPFAQFPYTTNPAPQIESKLSLRTYGRPNMVSEFGSNIATPRGTGALVPYRGEAGAREHPLISRRVEPRRNSVPQVDQRRVDVVRASRTYFQRAGRAGEGRIHQRCRRGREGVRQARHKLVQDGNPVVGVRSSSTIRTLRAPAGRTSYRRM